MSKNKGKILIVDDNEEVLIALKLFLLEHFEIVRTESNPNLIPSILNKETFDIIILDMNFSAGINTGNEGIFWMNKILQIDPAAVIILITAYGDIELAVRAIKQGATDFISKPWENKKILSTILTAYKLRQSKLEINQLKEKQKHLCEKITENHDFYIGRSYSMQKVIATVNKVAETDANVLILGENGTGKEVIAREIHKKSERANEVFISVDMAALNENLFESELFGHVKGAFTDARETRPGRFEIASKGTLFLDEIGNLSLPLQAKLLAVLQNRTVTRIGSNKPIPIDIRLICATNKPLYEMVTRNEFREDLLYRINTIQIDLPPLRERKEDIPELLNFFVEKYQSKYQKEKVRVSSSALDRLVRHYWSGNVRELKHAVEKAIILSETSLLKQDDFFFQHNSNADKKERISFNLETNEKKVIQNALRRYHGNMTDTARELGITRATLYRKLKKYEL